MTAKIVRLAGLKTLPAEVLEDAAQAAASCRIIAFPTDTVYGLGSTALVKAAARKIYQIKARPSLKPLPVLVWSVEEARRWVQWNPLAEALARRFWPGPLTLVLKPTAEGRILTFSEYPTVAIRIPAHPIALELLKASRIPWVATSANLSGSPALNDGESVIRQFKDSVDLIIEAGTLPGTESTLVDASGPQARVLRAGAVSAAAINDALGQTV